jgi:hypothetical protein
VTQGLRGVKWSAAALRAQKRTRQSIFKRFMAGESMRQLAKRIEMPLSMIDDAIRRESRALSNPRPARPLVDGRRIKMPNQIKSRAQQGFMGAIASGKVKKAGLTPAKARKILHDNRGTMTHLPERAPSRRSTRRLSTRGRR